LHLLGWRCMLKSMWCTLGQRRACLNTSHVTVHPTFVFGPLLCHQHWTMTHCTCATDISLWCLLHLSMHAAAQGTGDQHCGPFLNVVECDCLPVLKLFASEDNAWQWKREPVPVLDFRFHLCNSFRRVDLKCERVPPNAFHVDADAVCLGSVGTALSKLLGFCCLLGLGDREGEMGSLVVAPYWHRGW